MFRSLLFCEATRILRRCSNANIADKELLFFRRKLLDKGYALPEILQAFVSAKHVYASKKPHGVNSPSGPGSVFVRKAFLKLKHSSNLNYGFLRSVLQRHKCLISSSVLVCSKVQHSVFRLLYPHMWSSSTKLEVGGI